jgi:hypothetical protein
MSAPAVPQPSGNRASFASLLSSLTGASKPAGASKPENDPWDLSGLADDVATISYEQALRSHRRVPVAEPLAPLAAHEDSHAMAVAPASEPLQTSGLKNRKTASITIRVSCSEQTQLQERAAAAQLSVSAYLRSCIFEVEALRDQVREALLQIRTATNPQPHPTDASNSAAAFHKGFHFFQRWMVKPKSMI